MEAPVVFLVIKFDSHGVVRILVHRPDEPGQIKAYNSLVHCRNLDQELPYKGTSGSPSTAYYQVERNGVS